MEHRLPERDRPWMMRTYAGHSTAEKSNELYRGEPGQGPDRPVDRLRPARRRPATTPTTSSRAARSARSACRSPTRATCTRCWTASRSTTMNTSMTINATAAWLLALYIVTAEENGVDPARAPGHDAERHHQGVPGPRDLRVPARPVDAADRRHGRLHGRPRSRSGTRSTSAPTTCRRRARRRSRRSPTRCPTRSPCSTRSASASTEDADGQGLRPHLVLRQRRRALRRGARQAARDGRPVGGARPRALRRRPTPSSCASATACRSTRSG